MRSGASDPPESSVAPLLAASNNSVEAERIAVQSFESSKLENKDAVEMTKNLVSNCSPETLAAASSGWGWGMLNLNTTSFYTSMKRDLEDLQHQATELASGTVTSVARILQSNMEDARKAADFVREGVDSVVRSIDETLQINHEQLFGPTNQTDDDFDERNNGLTREELDAILNDPGTFTMEPRGSEADEYDEWVAVDFNVDAVHPQIERLLVENDGVARLYEDYVVADKLLTHNEFWLRYFFRLRQLSRAHQRNATLRALNEAKTRRSDDAGFAVPFDVDRPAADAVIVTQPVSATDAVYADDDKQCMPDQNAEITSAKIVEPVINPISGDATRFLQMAVDEECCGESESVPTTKRAPENDDVYSSASTESFSLVDRDASQESSVVGGADSRNVSPRRRATRNNPGGAADEEDEWEKEF